MSFWGRDQVNYTEKKKDYCCDTATERALIRAGKLFYGLDGIQTHDLCHSSALSYKVRTGACSIVSSMAHEMMNIVF